MQYSLTTLAIEDGAVAFADLHLPQPFRIDFSALQGEWNNISSAQEGDGQLALQGEVSDGSPMRIEGAFDPLGEGEDGNGGAQNDAQQDDSQQSDSQQNDDQDDGGADIYERARTLM